MTRAVIRILLAAFALSLFLAGGPAMAQGKFKPTGDFVADIKAANSSSGSLGSSRSEPDILKALDAKILPDLQYALKIATATGSKVTAPCYQAWIDIILARQKSVTNADGSEQPTPDPHLITDFEKAVEIRNALQSDSAFMLACAPVAQMVKKDVLSMMGMFISGGAGLAALIPGL